MIPEKKIELCQLGVEKIGGTDEHPLIRPMVDYKVEGFTNEPEVLAALLQTYESLADNWLAKHNEEQPHCANCPAYMIHTGIMEFFNNMRTRNLL